MEFVRVNSLINLQRLNPDSYGGPGVGVDNLLIENGVDNLLLEDGVCVILLE